MARRKTLPESVRAKHELAARLASLRSELFGDRGGPEMARRLNIPVRTWYNYEGGVTVPAEVMLKIIELTSVEPGWLLNGRGPKFREGRSDRPEVDARPSQTVGALLRTALQMLESGDPTRPRIEPADGRLISSFENEFEFSTTPNPTPAAPPATAHPHVRSVEEGGRPTHPPASARDWIEAQRDNRCIEVSGDAMTPIIADGAAVAYSERDEDFHEVDGKIVVVWIDGRPIVRWFQHCGRYALFRAENPATEPQQMLADLDNPDEIPRFRRVLWINTPH